MNNTFNQYVINYPSNTSKPKINLICFPFAGGGTVNYARWRADLSGDINLYAINLPGRERFFRQTCFTDYHQLITDLATLLAEDPYKPALFFGHSYGGITAYLTALQLKANHQQTPLHLFISARLPPAHRDIEELGSLDMAEFKTRLIEKYQGIPEPILNNPELLDIFLPIIQQDFKLYEQYPHIAASFRDPVIDCGITTIGFSEDVASEQAFLGWKNCTSLKHNHIQLAGGHFEILNNWKEVVGIINQNIATNAR